MSGVCCIGGVCIPYTAIIPLLLLGFQWVLVKLASWGLLPEFLVKHFLVVQQLQPTTTTTIENDDDNDETNHHHTTTTTTTTTMTSSSSSLSKRMVHSVKSMEEWKSLVETHDIVVVQFTADWCQPCKGVTPHYEALSQQYYGQQQQHHQDDSIIFLQVNVDELEQVASLYQIAILPTFIILHQKGKHHHASLRGSNPQQLSHFLSTTTFILKTQ